ncbi:hypothetical protein BACI9J_400002 [Bacillus altitudinis]|nr:hypothetical protein BACI9J_400002 [Bacillus altitudinis]
MKASSLEYSAGELSNEVAFAGPAVVELLLLLEPRIAEGRRDLVEFGWVVADVPDSAETLGVVRCVDGAVHAREEVVHVRRARLRPEVLQPLDG